MRKYETWEAIKMLTENPKLQFKNPCGSILTRKNNYIQEDESNKLSGDIFYKGHTWELVQQPISIQEAARLFDEERKTVICEFPDCNNKTNICRYSFKPESYGGMKSSDEITFYMINSGTWYVEDSHE